MSYLDDFQDVAVLVLDETKRLSVNNWSSNFVIYVDSQHVICIIPGTTVSASLLMSVLLLKQEAINQ